MKTTFIVLMIIFIVIAVSGLIAGIYGFMHVADAEKRNIDYEGVDTTKTSTSYEVEYKKQKGIEANYSTEYEIADFFEKIRKKDPKAINDAFIVFGMGAFIFSTLLAAGAGMIAYNNKFGWVFLVLVAGILGYVVYEFAKRY